MFGKDIKYLKNNSNGNSKDNNSCESKNYIPASTKSAYICAFLQILIIGFSFTFVKFALIDSTSTIILSHRFSVAFFAVLLPVILGKRKISIDKRDFFSILPLAIFYPVCMFLFQTIGLSRIPSSQAGIIQATVPIFTLILASTIIGEKSTFLQKFFVALSVSGIVIISVMGSKTSSDFSIVGIIFILLSTISNALYNVLSRKLTKKYSAYTLSFIMLFLGFLFFNLLAFEEITRTNTPEIYIKPLFSIRYIISILYLGVLSSLATSLLNSYAMKKIEATRMGVFSNIVSVISFVSGVIILGETVYYYHYIGILFTLIGAIGTNISNKR